MWIRCAHASNEGFMLCKGENTLALPRTRMHACIAIVKVLCTGRQGGRRQLRGHVDREEGPPRVFSLGNQTTFPDPWLAKVKSRGQRRQANFKSGRRSLQGRMLTQAAKGAGGGGRTGIDGVPCAHDASKADPGGLAPFRAIGYNIIGSDLRL
jgi:hypothetical protein